MTTPGAHTPLDPVALLGALQAAKVGFVVIGGFAVSFHGYTRTTKDLDVVPDPDAENLRRLWSALVALHARPADLDELSADELPPFTPQRLIDGQGNRVLYTNAGRLGLMLHVEDLDGELAYDELRSEADRADIPGLSAPVWIASTPRLLSMKRRAGRDQDLTDIAGIRRAQGLSD